MSLGGAIVSHYTNGAEAETLRGLIGAAALWGDRAAAGVSMPYVVFTEVGSGLINQGKNDAYRLTTNLVQLDTWATSRATAVAVLDAIEGAFLTPLLTVTGATHIATYFNNRLVMMEPEQNVFRGMVELDFRLVK